MVKTTKILRQELTGYRNPDTKISRMVEDGELFPLKQGWYETDPRTEPYLLASVLSRPSYLSFNYALAWYGLIPERVVEIMSATYKKRKQKVFTNDFGRFSFRDIPSEIYPYGYKLKRENDYPYQLATPEKALCDQLYTIHPPVRNQKELCEMLVENMRIDEEDLRNLNLEEIKFYSHYYPSTNVKLLYSSIKRYLL